MGKRKDTKIYQCLVKTYCDARYCVERQQKEVDEDYIKIGRAKKKFDTLSLTPVMDEEIKEWYNGYTSILQMSVGMAESSLRRNKEEMESAGTTLVEDYEEDLDILYSINNKRL